MKVLSYLTVVWSAFFIVSAAPSPAQDDSQFVMTAQGAQVCIGRWVLPVVIGGSGVCEGQLIGIPQLTALSVRQSVDRLDQLIVLLSSMDQKMDTSNELLGVLIEENIKSRTPTDRPGKEVSQYLREVITQRFDALPKGLLVNGFVMKELTLLKEDILQEVEKHYTVQQSPSIE